MSPVQSGLGRLTAPPKQAAHSPWSGNKEMEEENPYILPEELAQRILAGILLWDVVFVNITGCRFELPDSTLCELKQGCALSIMGNIGGQRNRLLVGVSILYPTCNDSDTANCLSVNIEGSVFVGSAGDTGGAINCEWMNLTLTNCDFSLSEKSKPAPNAAFVFHQGLTRHSFISSNVTFRAAEFDTSTSSITISFIVITADYLKTENLHISCPKASHAVEMVKVIGIYYVQHSYLCVQKCRHDEYTFQYGSMVIGGNSSQENPNNMSIQTVEPQCFPCPIGANCDGYIKALPNYWGYTHKIVHMIRCPNGYCCQEGESCKTIDSCNEKRTGLLCGECETNWTESLFTPDCIPSKNCSVGLVVFMYTLCAVAYTLFLLVFNWVKEEGPLIIKKLYSPIKKQQTHKPIGATSRGQPSNENQHCENVEPSAVKMQNEKEDDVMKYIQILLYYIQDAALFTIEIPGHSVEEENIIVKILQFSPEVLTTMYTDVFTLCFRPGSDAVTKVLLRTLFEYCIILFILISFLFMKVGSVVSERTLKLIRARMVQTFLLALLFSDQQMVLGCFALIQCV